MAEPTATTNPPTPSVDTSTATNAVATPAPGAGEDLAKRLAEVEAEKAALLKWKATADEDLKKGREARKQLEEAKAAAAAEAEKKAREAGDHAALNKALEEKQRALEAQLAEVLPKADRLNAHEKRVMAKLEAAKAKGDLPNFIVRAIDVAATRDVDEAADILDEFRASQGAAPASKQAAPSAPAQGAPASIQPAAKKLSEMTAAEIQSLPDAELNKLLGKTNGSSHIPTWRERFFVK